MVLVLNETDIFIAVISKVQSKKERVTFGETTNFIVEQYPDLQVYEVCITEADDPRLKDHALSKWLESIKERGWWMPWMDDATAITWYSGTIGEMT